MITDEQSLVSAKSRFSHDIKVYDDGFGPLWIYHESPGIVGIVRAQNYEEAWDCILDEILTPVSSEELCKSPEDYYVCERDYHCPAPKDYSKGICHCSELKYSYTRTCWKCRQFRTPNEQKACNCTDSKELSTVYLALAEGCHYMPNSSGTSGIVQTDLNGSALDELTQEMVGELKITIEIKDNKEE